MSSTLKIAILLASAALPLTAAPVPALAAPAHAHGHAKAAGTLVDIAVGSADHTTLVAAVKAAGLVDTLNGAGPFTVFAPTNAAFAKLPAGTVDTLLKPENKAVLTKVLTYHVVAGKVTATQLIAKIKADGGAAKLTTVAGGTLTATIVDGGVVLTDEKGGTAHVVAADLLAKNGVIHVTDAVSLPN